MHRLRLLLQGPLAAWVVVWAGLVAGVNVAPGTTLSLSSPGGWTAHPDAAVHTMMPFPGQPLIAEVRGLRAEVPPAPPTNPPPAVSALAAKHARASRTGYAPPRTYTEAEVVSGVGRCRLLCTYRL